jgi:hypothetical protein
MYRGEFAPVPSYTHITTKAIPGWLRGRILPSETCKPQYQILNRRTELTKDQIRLKFHFINTPHIAAHRIGIAPMTSVLSASCHKTIHFMTHHLRVIIGSVSTHFHMAQEAVSARISHTLNYTLSWRGCSGNSMSCASPRMKIGWRQ